MMEPLLIQTLDHLREDIIDARRELTGQIEGLRLEIAKMSARHTRERLWKAKTIGKISGACMVLTGIGGFLGELVLHFIK